MIAGLAGAEEKKASIGTLDLLRGLEPAPQTTALAERAGFTLQGLAAAKDDTPSRPGDQITALVSLGSVTGSIPTRQWVIRLQLQPTPTAGPAKNREITYYTNTGEKFTYRSSETPMALETLGPVSKETDVTQPMPVRKAKISVATDYLGLDLYRATNVLYRIKSSPNKNGLTLTSRQKPFPADEIKIQQPRAAQLGLTSDDLRSFTGTLPALLQFLQIVQRTPDLQSILYQVIEKPSVFDVLAHAGDNSLHFDFLGGGNSVGQELFWPADPKHEFGVLFFNLNIYGKPVLAVALHVAPPHAPLEVSAGIVGIAAWAPEKPDKFIVVRVVSARAGQQ